MVDSLLTDAGSRRALMVEITKDSVQVSVLAADGKPVTWAHRDGKSAEVPSDLAYVDQATFDVSAVQHLRRRRAVPCRGQHVGLGGTAEPHHRRLLRR